MVKVCCSLAPEPAQTDPHTHASCMPCPTLIPPDHVRCLFAAQVTRSAVVLIPCELGCASVPSGASCSARKVFAAAPGAIEMLGDRVRVFCRVPIVRTPEHVEARGQPRTAIGRGLKEAQVALISIQNSMWPKNEVSGARASLVVNGVACARARVPHAIEMPRPGCAPRCPAGTARINGSL